MMDELCSNVKFHQEKLQGNKTRHNKVHTNKSKINHTSDGNLQGYESSYRLTMKKYEIGEPNRSRALECVSGHSQLTRKHIVSMHVE